MTNDTLSLIDQLIAQGKPLPNEMARQLRERLAGCAAEAVALRKKASDESSRADAQTRRLEDLAEWSEATGWIAKADVCEACGDVLVPAPKRCERHVSTEPGDQEWTMP